MSLNTDILIKYYEQELKQALSHEYSRSSATSLILIISGVLITIITYDIKLDHKDIPLSALLIVIGLFGGIFNIKYYERYFFHYSRATAYRNRLEKQIPKLKLKKVRIKADSLHKTRFGKIVTIRLNILWLTLNLLISIFGITLILIIIY